MLCSAVVVTGGRTGDIIKKIIFLNHFVQYLHFVLSLCVCFC